MKDPIETLILLMVATPPDKIKDTAKQFIYKLKQELIKVADEGEYEDMRREVERYFGKNNG